MRPQEATIPANQNPHYLIKPSDIEMYHVKLIRRGLIAGSRNASQEANDIQIFQVNDWHKLTSDPDWLKKTGFARYSIIHDPTKK